MTTEADGASPVECSVERQVQERTLFEAYAKTLGYSVDPDNTREGRAGGYWSSHTHLMWGAWRAAVACASPENFDADLGRKIARQNAVQKVWPLMGYALKQQLAERTQAKKIYDLCGPAAYERNNGFVLVCPEKDHECGDHAVGWCLACPKRSRPT